MEFAVAVGTSDFEEIRAEGDYYVDKTELIYELVAKTRNKVTLFTRPRRFGKTLTMSMLKNFFDIRKDSRAIFEGLDIMCHEDFCKKWMNQFPVIFISFKDVDGLSFESAYDSFKSLIVELCIGLANIKGNSSLNEDESGIFKRLRSKTATDAEVKGALKTIIKMLHAVYGKKVVLLIDEYDVPLARASERDTPENHFYERMLDVMRGIMSASLKDNEFLEFAVITGCLRIAKESIFTGTNNFASYSVLDEEFSEYFGFTDEEVGRLLEAADRKEQEATVKEWYDGYVFGSCHVYCPWDVINYLSSLRKNPAARPKCYWKNSSHNGILLSFVGRTDFDVSGKFEAMMNGGTIEQTVSDMLTYDTLHSSEDNLWSVLIMTGYVTKANPDEDGETVHLRIPNREVATIFQDTVASHFQATLDTAAVDGLLKSLWNGDAGTASKIMSELLWNTISYNDYHEDYYHAFLAGVFVGRGYAVESNKEKGLGRPDILLQDKKNRRALIIEAKKSKREEAMAGDCKTALSQIDSRKYAEDLLGYTQIMCYGIAFFRKQAKVALAKE